MMTRLLEGRVALVAGGTRGAGRGIAVELGAAGQAAELRPYHVAAVALTPGFLRSEAVLDHFDVTEKNWRDAIAKDEHFAASETPAYIGRAVVALASDEHVMRRTGRSLSTWNLAKEYGFSDTDGSQPNWGTHFEQRVAPHLSTILDELSRS